MNTYWIFKPIGWTPKMCVEEFKKLNNTNEKYAFAGRLDPMAYGLIPIMRNTDKNIRMNMEGNFKTYRFKIISGIITDTYDILGIIKNFNCDIMYVDEFIKNCCEMKEQEYPPFSSKTVKHPITQKMVPLWQMSLNNLVPDELPMHDIEIKYIKSVNIFDIKMKNLYKKINKRISSLPNNNNYRQKEIIEQWKNFDPDMNIKIYEFEARISKGTYIRSLGNKFGGCCYDILRTSVGEKELNEKYNKFEFKII